MGDLIDLEKIDSEHNLRCEHAKLGVIIVNFIGVPSSLIILLISIYQMKKNKKRLSFLTKIIMFLFLFEIMNCISKLLQLFKYFFEDTRSYPDPNNIPTPRGVICQIQIVLSIISDMGCLSGTLLLSYRCYEVIKNRIRIFDSKKWQNLSFISISAFSTIVALLFLFLDRKITNDSIKFKFDRRDRCNYWCWLQHDLSFICYIIYDILLIAIIVFFVLTTLYFRKSYKTLIEKCVVIYEEPNLSNNNKDKDNINYTDETKEKRFISSHDKKRLKELQIMQVKCFIYPIISIIIWTLSSIYRIIDDRLMGDIDNGIKKDYDELNNKRDLQRFIETNLIFHSILSSFRGVLYGYAFIIFEDKAFNNIFRDIFYEKLKCCFCCCHFQNIDNFIDEGEEEETLINIFSNLSNTETNQKDNNEEIKFRKTGASDYGRNNTDLNTSDYRYND